MTLLEQFRSIKPHFADLEEVIKNTTFYCGNVREAVSDYLFDYDIKMTEFQYNIIMDKCSQSSFKSIDPQTLAMFED